MRLIDTKAYSSTKTFILKDFIGSNIPEYAILSHTWGKPEDEVTLKDIEGGHAEEKDACRKLRFLCRRAIQDGLLWAWCDTCCIDKTSAVELAEAINSMYRWYKHATKCYALLSDVCARGTGDWQRLFRGSRWFTRCWTLQELLAPTTIDFFSAEYDHIGDKNLLLQMISEITGISIEALKTTDFSGMGIDERFDWMRGRNATREEDEAYSLFGIFGVQLPLLYGEGVEEAVKRLRKKIIKKAKEAAVPGIQQSTVAPVASSRSSLLVYNNSIVVATLETTLHEFRQSLPDEEQKEFQLDTFDTLNQTLFQLQRDQEMQKSMMDLNRLNEFITRMRVITNAFEAHGSLGLRALVWGPVRLILHTTAPNPDAFDTILDAYKQIGQALPQVDSSDVLCTVQLELVKLYVGLFAFHKQILKFCRGPSWQRIFKPLWKGYIPEFAGLTNGISQLTKLIDERVKLPHHEDYRTKMSKLSQEMQRVDNSYFASKRDYACERADIIRAFEKGENETVLHYQSQQREINEEKRKLEERLAADNDKKLLSVHEWLAFNRFAHTDHKRYQSIRGVYLATAQWILNEGLVNDWIAAEIPNSATLWIHGIPGAGKTILASSIIDRCNEVKTTTTSYFYCHEGDEGSSSALSILKGLIHQLLQKDSSVLQLCHIRRAASGEPTLRSITQAQRLLEDCCIAHPQLFLIVDGLDECDIVERRQAIDILADVTALVNDNHKGPRTPVRVLFMSQEYADIKRTLLKSHSKVAPQMLKLKDDQVANDISTYTKVWVDKIATRFCSVENPFTEDLREYMRNLIAANAKGMFLYAELVLQNLFQQVNREDLFSAIQKENFPKGLQEAYERILQRIRKTSAPKEWVTAKRLLGWMVCAKRQLTWKEIQVAFSIDVENQEVMYDDRHLRTHIHDICGSLVILDGDRVSLVHSTAKTFITTTTEGIHEPSIECELASLCLQYLTFPCFDEDEHTEKDLEDMMLKGHFAFQDYAIAKWFYHVNAFVNSGQKFLNEADERDRHLTIFSTALDDFMTRYDDENWAKGLVKDCQTRCEIFDGEDCAENLVLLTSHIYTFQQKGFEARHKISIKSLASALERNRKLLEKFPSKKTTTSNELQKYHTFYDDKRYFKCNKITCRYFSEGFNDEKARKRHVNIHDRPFQCEVVDCLGAEGFANPKDLQKHIRSFHPEMSDLAETFNSITVKREKAIHACTICGKTFTRKFHQKHHELSHRGERPYPCPECGRAFTRKNDMERHRKLHERGR